METRLAASPRLLRSPKLLKQIVASQIQRFSGLNLLWLSFPPDLERRFERDTCGRRSTRLWLEGLLAICIFDLFLFMDHVASPIHFFRALALRLGVVTPLALVVGYIVARQPGQFVREGGLAFVSWVAGMIHLHLESSQSAVDFAFAQFGILAVILFANTSLRLRFPFAFAATCGIIAGDLIFLRADVLLLHQQKVLGFCLIVCTAAIAVVSNYSSNREERLNYLLYLRGDVLVEDLSRSHDRLARIAETDALTGLANRHAFERKMKKLWKKAHLDGSSLSLIVVDVDKFKRLNDTYGHLYGDKVLKHIGALLTESLRHSGDFAARFGGEEFVILLPDTTKQAAVAVAERLRKRVEAAGFPQIESGDRPFLEVRATVSCGVATACPGTSNGQHLFIEAADKAMYEAKAEGRNQVRCAA